MYQTERYGTNGTLSYAFPISSGNYNVVLHFAELYWTAAGKRLFDVNIEGAKVLDNYDIYRKVGAFTATTENFPVTVSDGTLNINFSSLAVDGGVDQPKMSAIEIVAAGTSTTTAVSAPSTVTNSGNIVTIKAAYASAPVNPSASFADLGNNKRIGFILTKDDGGSGDYAAVYPIINGGISPLNGVSCNRSADAITKAIRRKYIRCLSKPEQDRTIYCSTAKKSGGRNSLSTYQCIRSKVSRRKANGNKRQRTFNLTLKARCNQQEYITCNWKEKTFEKHSN